MDYYLIMRYCKVKSMNLYLRYKLLLGSTLQLKIRKTLQESDSEIISLTL